MGTTQQNIKTKGALNTSIVSERKEARKRLGKGRDRIFYVKNPNGTRAERREDLFRSDKIKFNNNDGYQFEIDKKTGKKKMIIHTNRNTSISIWEQIEDRKKNNGRLEINLEWEATNAKKRPHGLNSRPKKHTHRLVH